MQDHLIEMSVGETIQIGQFLVTLVDIEGEELCLQIEGDENGQNTSDEFHSTAGVLALV